MEEEIGVIDEVWAEEVSGTSDGLGESVTVSDSPVPHFLSKTRRTAMPRR